MLNGDAEEPDALELALVELVGKAYRTPKELCPDDLEDLRALVGDGAVTYAFVLCQFHFVNRMADLLHIDADGIPESVRVLGPIRKITVQFVSAVFSKIFNLENRIYDRSFVQVVDEFLAQLPSSAATIQREDLAPLESRPHIIEILSSSVKEREQYSSLRKGVVRKIHALVEENLPDSEEDSTGFHERPEDPVEAFVFVGTRYAQRTTLAMIDALREAGYDDLGILDLAIAISDANMWVRFHRLLGLKPALLI